MRPPRRAHLWERFLRVAFVPAYAAFAVPISACRPERAETPGTTATPAMTPPVMAATEPRPESLSLDLVLPRSVRAGERVQIILRVQNRTERTIDLYLRGRTTTFDVVVARAGGEVVWRRLEDEIIPAIVHLRTLAPAERFEVITQWDQRTKQGTPVQPGEYTARGLLLVEGEPLETPSVPLRIAQR